MKLTSPRLDEGGLMPREYCFCVTDPLDHAQGGPNRNPPLGWSSPPEGTRSLALICHDPDAPSRPDDVNKEGCVVPEDLPRVDFFHWVLVDLDPGTVEIPEAAFSDGVTPRGKRDARPSGGGRQGLNSYTDWFAGDDRMAGEYYGYDGPCPPWNDALVHRYVFTLYALDIERCPVDGAFTGARVLEAIEGHILDQSRLTVTYTLNPLLEG